MPDRVMLVLGLPAWYWAMLFPIAMLALMLGWLTLMLKRQRLSSFAVKGLGLSITIQTGAESGESKQKGET